MTGFGLTYVLMSTGAYIWLQRIRHKC